MAASSNAHAIPSALRKKLVGVALASSEFRAAIVEGTREIQNCATPNVSEATIEGCFERILYALLRDIGVPIHFEKEVRVDLRRHTAKGRLDSRVGAVVLEYKRPSLLRTQQQTDLALAQLEEYLLSLSSGNTAQLVGVLTNGVVVYEVHARTGVIISRPAATQLNPDALDRIARLLVSLELTALTAENLIRDFCGSNTDGALFRAARTLYDILTENPQPKTSMLLSEWQEMFRLSHDDLSQQKRIEDRRVALDAIFGVGDVDAEHEYLMLFALQTAYAIVLKLIAFRVVSDVFHVDMEPEFKSLASAKSKPLRSFCQQLEDGDIFRELGILNVLEGDFFAWYCDQNQWSDAVAEDVRRILEILARYEDAPSIFRAERAHDLFREIYQAAMPRALRSSLGEFYTQYWLAEHVLDTAIGGDSEGWRAIDPCCGSGTFVIAAIMRLRRECAKSDPCDVLSEVLGRVAAIDLNPISVLMTRINYFIHISDLLQTCGVTSLVIPVYLGDAASTPERVTIDGVECLRYQLKTLRSPIDTSLPVSLVADTERFMSLMLEFERHIKANDKASSIRLLVGSVPRSERTAGVIAEITRVTELLIDLELNGWDGIWARILSNFMTTACLGRFTAVVGNPPWIDWKNLPAGYRERIKGMCIERGLFSGAGRTGGINLNICALIAYTSMVNWLDDNGRLAFLMPRELINQPSYEGWRHLGGRGWGFLEFHDWTKAGYPFDPVKEDFLTFVIGAEKTAKTVPVFAYEKNPRDKSKPSEWRNFEEARQHLTVTPRAARRIIPRQSAFTVASTEADLDLFGLIAGECEYTGREGVEFYPQELVLFEFDSLGPVPGTVWLRNIQVTKSKYKHPQKRVLLETAYLHPLVKGPAIGRFSHEYAGLIVSFPYEASDPIRPVPRERLRLTSQRLFRYYLANREAFEGQTKFSDKIRGDNPGEFYGLARTGPYSFAETYVAFRDNTKWCATVVTKASMPWGESKRFVFQNHAVSMCERASDRRFIGLEEAHYVCAILNTPVVERFIYASSDERSFKIRPPVYVPSFDRTNPLHCSLAAASVRAHRQPDAIDAIRRETEKWYLKICESR